MTEYQIIKEPGGFRTWKHKRIAGWAMGFDYMQPLNLYDDYSEAALARVELYRNLPLSEMWMEDER